MKKFLKKHHRVLFYSVWVVLALIQARFTELLDDEAYYWVYSRFLAWGYFDHPPMIALMIKIGYAIFHNELGVRFVAVLMNAGSLLIIEKLLANKKPGLFYSIVLSIAALQAGGFLGAPDTPLIFFTALFFLVYQKFSVNPSWRNAAILGGAGLLLLYSKYHGVLVLLFTVLSEPSLLKKRKVYLAAVIAFTGYLPHLYWQYSHGWPSFEYHLVERNAPAYHLSFTLDYLAGQILLPGPVAGLLLLPAAFLYKVKDKTEKTLRFCMLGFYGFFLLSSFRGYIEANWTAPVLVPLIVLNHRYLSGKQTWRKLLAKLLPLTLTLTLVARVAMIADIFPADFIRLRFHAWKAWPQELKKKTRGQPVVFKGSYQRASKYWFYSGQVSCAPTYYRERRSNYDFWPIEDSLLGKAVYILDIYDLEQFPDSVQTPIGWVGFRLDSAYSSFGKIQIRSSDNNLVIGKNGTLALHCKTEAPAFYADYVFKNQGLKAGVLIGIFNKEGWIEDIPLPLSLVEILKKSFTVEVPLKLASGRYYLLFSIEAGKNMPTHNSRRINFAVE